MFSVRRDVLVGQVIEKTCLNTLHGFYNNKGVMLTLNSKHQPYKRLWVKWIRNVKSKQIYVRFRHGYPSLTKGRPRDSLGFEHGLP